MSAGAFKVLGDLPKYKIPKLDPFDKCVALRGASRSWGTLQLKLTRVTINYLSFELVNVVWSNKTRKIKATSRIISNTSAAAAFNIL